jgi:hypothetical protein
MVSLADSHAADATAPIRYPVPVYLPASCASVLPWARRHAAHVAARARVAPADCWDEAVTALLRAAVFFRPGAGTFHRYAQTAVTRGLWRVTRAAHTQQRHGTPVALEEAPMLTALTAPSAEEEACARELAAQRARVLREHAALATDCGDVRTARQLRAAAATAARTARCARAAHPTRRA